MYIKKFIIYFVLKITKYKIQKIKIHLIFKIKRVFYLQFSFFISVDYLYF